MSGFDNGSSQSGVVAEAKQFGSVLRGAGPPVPAAGLTGDLYLDTQTAFLYEKRTDSATNPWGSWLFQVPATYVNTLKWFGTSAPDDSFGIQGDYCLLWGGFSNYGLQPYVYGPKLQSTWAENGNGITTQLDPSYIGGVYPLGCVDESSTQVAYSTSTQLIAAGIIEEYVLTYPVSNTAGTVIYEIGLASFPASMAGVVLNPQFTATDTHQV